ncbi:unnamed protein product, partial [Didymodactylos carnosus]
TLITRYEQCKYLRMNKMPNDFNAQAALQVDDYDDDPATYDTAKNMYASDNVSEELEFF